MCGRKRERLINSAEEARAVDRRRWLLARYVTDVTGQEMAQADKAEAERIIRRLPSKIV